MGIRVEYAPRRQRMAGALRQLERDAARLKQMQAAKTPEDLAPMGWVARNIPAEPLYEEAQEAARQRFNEAVWSPAQGRFVAPEVFQGEQDVRRQEEARYRESLDRMQEAELILDTKLTTGQGARVQDLNNKKQWVLEQDDLTPDQKENLLEQIDNEIVNTPRMPTPRERPPWPEVQDKGQVWQGPGGVVLTRDDKGNVKKLMDPQKPEEAKEPERMKVADLAKLRKQAVEELTRVEGEGETQREVRPSEGEIKDWIDNMVALEGAYRPPVPPAPQTRYPPLHGTGELSPGALEEMTRAQGRGRPPAALPAPPGAVPLEGQPREVSLPALPGQIQQRQWLQLAGDTPEARGFYDVIILQGRGPDTPEFGNIWRGLTKSQKRQLAIAFRASGLEAEWREERRRGKAG